MAKSPTNTPHLKGGINESKEGSLIFFFGFTFVIKCSRNVQGPNIKRPNGLNSGAEFNAAPMRWFGWVRVGWGKKAPYFFLLGGAFLDLIRGLLG